MKILITNDDGIDAQGPRSLIDLLGAKHEVMMMAPMEQKSALGHGITLGKPLEIIPVEENIYGLNGLPADCITVGSQYFYSSENSGPDIVISGINHGGNLGQDIYYSGTVAAAREAAFHGIPSMAVSLVFSSPHNNSSLNGDAKYFSTAAKVVLKLISENIHQKIGKMNILNINVPNLPFEKLQGIEVTELSFRNYPDNIEKRTNPQGRDSYLIHGGYRGFTASTANSDCQAVLESKVSLTPIELFPPFPTEKMKDFFVKNLF